MRKFVLMILCIAMLLTAYACGDQPDPNPGPGDETGDYDYGSPSSWAADNYASRDLGAMYFDAFPDDHCYDWGFTTIYENGKYKTWWVRPSNFDAIFYAESVDLKNWTNVNRVITFTPNPNVMIKHEGIQGMLGRPTVLHVDDTYYMYFEAPASSDPDITATVLEWDNQIFLATSPDGLDWTIYTENGKPKPVVAMNPADMGNKISKEYGVGQPSAFYKDGTFYMYYCNVVGGVNELKVATSADGRNFGDASSHVSLGLRNGAGVKYNAATGKYMLILPSGDDYYVMESDSPTVWPTKSMTEFPGKANKVTQNAGGRQYAFPDFVTDGKGQITTKTFYITYTNGEKSTTGDWRELHTTWEGNITAVNPKEFGNRTIELPNGKPGTTGNLSHYNNKSTKLHLPEANAIYAQDSQITIDGLKDAAYDSAAKIEINRGVYNWGSNITTTHGEAYLAWNEDYLYCFIDVYDEVVSTKFQITKIAEMYRRDSVDIFFDVPNDHTMVNESWGMDQYLLSLGANNQDFMIKGSNDYDLTEEFGTVQRRVRMTDNGYAVEFRIEWYEWVKDLIAENYVIGMDFQINDDMGMGDREAMIVWSDHTGNAFRYYDRFGDVVLKK